MKVVLDIKESRASFFLELINSLTYVRVLRQVKDARKNKHIQELTEAFNDVTLYEQGKKKLKSAKDLLNEL